MDPIGFQKKLDDLVIIVDSITKTMKEKHVDTPHSRIRSSPVHQTFGYCIPKNPTRESQSYSPFTLQYDIVTPNPHQAAVTRFPISVVTPKPVRHTTPTHVSNQEVAPTPSDLHLEHHLASFVGPNRGHHCGRDHLYLSKIRVAAPPCRSSPSLDGRPSIGSSAGSVPHDSPLRPTPLTSLVLDSAIVILVKKCIKKKRSPEPEYIHFMDANDITNNEDFFADETEVIKLDSLHDLNHDLGDLEPLDLDTLVHPDPNLIMDIPLDKVYLDDINLISKEADMILSTMKLNSKDSDLIVTFTGLTSHNSELILDNSECDLDNLELGVTQENLLPDLHPDLSGPEFIDLRIIIQPDPIENINISLEDINDPSSYHTPDFYILPSIFLSFRVKDLLSPSWMTLLDYSTAPRRLSVTLAETPCGDAFLAKDVFIAPPIPVPLNMKTLCPLIL
ncbi:hypothetical protein M5K25_012982 [Dendrobium thyrsiflorum]|uniref:Reverse transcriptase domain-containing protein n=1 Tax=Dendrobium thyrsiflorum TaxID=117978 RepID=A0ABD0UZ32_DENTH